MVEIELLPSSPSSSSSSSSSISRLKYDVFLSFSGKDTRNKFTDFLYDALDQRGIVTFRDDKRLERGEDFAPELLKAIGESWCSIIVFSESYAFSSWCLDELEEIVKQKNDRGHKVYPVFYDMEAFELRRQKGSVEKAFAKHEQRYNKDKVDKWRAALTEVANIHGWPSKNTSEPKLIKHLVNKISRKLFQTYSTAPDDLIGIHSRLEELYSKLDIGGDGVRIVGICGMGGIGKTTLARVVYDQTSPQDFEGESFLLGVREASRESSGLVTLQKQLLSEILSEEDFKFSNVLDGNKIISQRLCRKKVLIVVDDADNIEQQLKYLVGRRDWFGSGSRIIITTRDEHLLRSYGVDDVYKPKIFDPDEAFEFFTLKAFNKDTELEKDLIELSECVIKYADGLPLALEVLGGFFRGVSDAGEWRKAIERLQRDSNKKIHDILEISLGGLEETEKDIFLDIACFFKGEKKDFVMKILDGCGFSPDAGIKALIDKSLVTVDGYNRLRMHDLLQKMGRKFVRHKFPKEPGKRCRLWEENDVYDVLIENSTATEAIEGMIINIKGEQNEEFSSIADVFLKMKKLRLLRVFNLPKCGDITFLSNKLALFEWHRYPLKSLPSSFQPKNLVALLLPDSRIEQLWKGEKSLNKLKSVNLKGCENLIKVPDFTTTPNLENLILEGCTKIKQLPSSIGHLGSLVLLNLKDCTNLVSLPDSIDGCQCLKTLNLSGCSKVENLPENLQQVECLMELDLSGTAVRQPQSFIFQFKNLKVLSFKGCRGPPSSFLSYWPNVIQRRRSTTSMALTLRPLSGLSSIMHLDLSDCNLGERSIPSDISRLSSLKFLILSGNSFITLPETLSKLSNLYLLRLSNCKGLKFLPKPLTSIQHVDIDGCDSLEVVPNPKIVCNSQDGHGTSINCANCFSLAVNISGLTLMKKHLKVFADTRKSIDIFIPGSEIAEWFSHYRFESSINQAIRIRLPPNIRKDSQWKGVALCCVLASGSGDDDWGDEDIQIVGVTYDVKNSRQVVPGFYLESPYHSRCRVKKDHIWLQYWPRKMLLQDFSEEKSDGIEDLPNQENDVIDFFFLPFRVAAVRPQVKKCGIRLVFEEDLEEMDCADDIHQETDGPKRKRNIIEDEAEEGPQPKRLKEKILDFIMGKK